MTLNRQKSQIIDKREAISPIFKDILRFQSRSRVFSPIRQVFKDSRNISLSTGNQSPNFYKMYFSGD